MGRTSRHHPSLGSVLALAGRQHGVVTRGQLVDAGLSRNAIEHRLRTGRLHAVFRGVYALGHPRLTREGGWLAAVLACRGGAALSHLCAAAHWDIRERAVPSRPQVSVPTRNGRRGPRGIELHRTVMGPEDVTVRGEIPVTSLSRTLADLARILDTRQLKSAVRQAERLHRLDLEQLHISLGVSSKHARLRRVLDEYVAGAKHTEADVEMAFLELCDRHALPRPQAQVPIGRYRADFMWPERNLVVEIDDRQSHDGYVAFREDRVRDRAMKAAGLEVLRFTRTEVLRTPDVVVHDLVAAACRAAAVPGPPTPQSVSPPGEAAD
jgi:very-short-patch-repair endonuclease